jgi:hypothetical protein
VLSYSYVTYTSHLYSMYVCKTPVRKHTFCNIRCPTVLLSFELLSSETLSSDRILLLSGSTVLLSASLFYCSLYYVIYILSSDHPELILPLSFYLQAMSLKRKSNFLNNRLETDSTVLRYDEAVELLLEINFLLWLDTFTNSTQLKSRHYYLKGPKALRIWDNFRRCSLKGQLRYFFTTLLSSNFSSLALKHCCIFFRIRRGIKYEIVSSKSRHNWVLNKRCQGHPGACHLWGLETTKISANSLPCKV